MPRGGKNHAQGGGEIAQGGKKFSRAQDSIFLPPPLANFSCTPLCRPGLKMKEDRQIDIKKDDNDVADDMICRAGSLFYRVSHIPCLILRIRESINQGIRDAPCRIEMKKKNARKHTFSTYIHNTSIR